MVLSYNSAPHDPGLANVLSPNELFGTSMSLPPISPIHAKPALDFPHADPGAPNPSHPPSRTLEQYPAHPLATLGRRGEPHPPSLTLSVPAGPRSTHRPATDTDALQSPRSPRALRAHGAAKCVARANAPIED
jgi:hypothetical protein